MSPSSIIRDGLFQCAYSTVSFWAMVELKSMLIAAFDSGACRRMSSTWTAHLLLPNVGDAAMNMARAGIGRSVVGFAADPFAGGGHACRRRGHAAAMPRREVGVLNWC